MKKKILSVMISAVMYLTVLALPAAYSGHNPAAEKFLPAGEHISAYTAYNEESTSAPTETMVPETEVTDYPGDHADYDLEGTVFCKDYEWHYYVGDEINYDRFRLEMVFMTEYGWYGWMNEFSYSSGKFAECYTIDTSEVDMSKPGKYPIYFTSNKGVIARVRNYDTDILEYKEYNVLMDGRCSFITITVDERPVPTEPDGELSLITNGMYSYRDIVPGDIGGVTVKGYDDGKMYDEGESPFTAHIEDESIAVISRISGNVIVIKGLEIGSTVLTVTAPDGRTASIVVVVEERDDDAHETLPLPTVSQPGGANQLGDLNGDKLVNIADLVYLQRILNRNMIYCDSADINRDGTVNVFDMVILKRIVLGEQ